MGEIALEEIGSEPIEIKKNFVNRDKEIKNNSASTKAEKPLISCLKNEKVVVKFVPREGGLVNDPKHILYGGLGMTSKRKFVTPQYESGTYYNVLTNDEKTFLEYVMGMAENALSIYRKEDNYWANNGVILGKEKTILDLSNPEEYIKYKILLANKDFICPSEEELRSRRKATYQFVLTRESEELESSLDSLNTASKAYMIYGTLKDDLDKLALIIENVTGKIVSSKSKQSVQANVDDCIKKYPKKFIEEAEDPYLETKLLIKKSVEIGSVRKRGTYYYLTETNAPLCTDTQEPTIKSACVFINAPKNQEIKLTLEAKLK